MFGNPSTSLFGKLNNTGTGLFGQLSTFGQPSNIQNGFGFGNANAQSQSTTNTLFGSKPTFPATPPSNFGTFQNPQYNVSPQAGATPFFGQSSPTSGTSFFTSSPAKFETVGTTVVKFAPHMATEMIGKNQSTFPISTRYMSITIMKEYETKSFEELRLEDYDSNRKGSQQASSVANNLFSNPAASSAGTFMFSSKPVASQAFGQKSPIFGQSQPTTFGMKNAFAVPATSSTSPFSCSPKLFATASSLQPTTASFSISPNSPAINTFGTNSLFGTNTSFEPQTNIGKTNFFTQNKQPFVGFGTTATTPSSFNEFGQPKSVFGDSKLTTNSFGLPSITQSQPTSVPISEQTQQQSFSFPNNLKFPLNYGPTQSGGGLLSGFRAGQIPTPVNLAQTKVVSNFVSPVPQNSLIEGFIQCPPAASTAFQLPQQLPLFSTTDRSNIYEQIMASGRIYPAIPFSKNDLKLSHANKPCVTHPQTLKKVLDEDLKVSPTESKNIPVKLRLQVPKYKSAFFNDIHETDSTLEENIFAKIRPRNPRQLFVKKRQKPQTLPKTTFIPNNVSDEDSCVNDDKIPSIYNREMKNKDTMDESLQPVDQNSSPSRNTCHLEQKNGEIDDKNLETVLQSNDTNTEDHPITDNNAQDSTGTSDDKPIKGHPTGIICTRDDYYTIPSLEELTSKIQPDGRVMVDNFTIGRTGFGSVYFPERFNVAGINIDRDVHFNLKEIVIYEDDDNKPPFGEQLNRPAIITLEKVYPRDKQTGELITDAKRLREMEFEKILSAICRRDKTNFIKYQPATGSWIFQVYHF